MDWKNTEQLPDFTAGEAMCRVMIRDPQRLDAVDSEGCRLLAEAVVMQAAQDYFEVVRNRSFAAEQRTELEAFFRSGYFRLLSGMEGTRLMRRIRQEVDAE